MLAAADDTLLPFTLPNIAGKKLTAVFDGGRISSDGGLLLRVAARAKTALLWSNRHQTPQYP